MLDKRSTALLVLVLLGVHLAVALLVAFRAAYPTDIDERAHLSYVRHVYDQGAAWPDFRSMRLVDDRDPARWSGTSTNLNHPPLYYWLLAPLAFDASSDPRATVTRLRLANVALAFTASALAALAGLWMFGDPLARFSYISLVALNPRAATLGGMINNDNLAALAGVVVLLGLVAVQRGHANGRNGVTIGLGLAAAGFTKLTALIGLGTMVALHHVWLTLRREGRNRDMARHYGMIAALGVVGLAPYLANLSRYGELLYLNREYFTIPEHDRRTLDALEFVIRALTEFAWSWPTYLPADPLQLYMVPVLLALAVLGLWLRPTHPLDDAGARQIGIAAIAALSFTLALNVLFLYRLHLRTGYETGVYFRYYLPLWPAVAAAIALLPSRLRADRHREAVALAIFAALLYATVVPVVAEAFNPR
jgi:hypothetical protein